MTDEKRPTLGEVVADLIEAYAAYVERYGPWPLDVHEFAQLKAISDRERDRQVPILDRCKGP